MKIKTFPLKYTEDELINIGEFVKVTPNCSSKEQFIKDAVAEKIGRVILKED